MFLSRPPWFEDLCVHLLILLSFYRHPRQKGMGSLPSASNTDCCFWTAALSLGATLFGIAQYIPASAKRVNTISVVLFVAFMGEVLRGKVLQPAKYMPYLGFWYAAKSVDIYKISITGFVSIRRHLSGQGPEGNLKEILQEPGGADLSGGLL